MIEKPSPTEKRVTEQKTLTERRLARLAGMPATPEQLKKAEDAINRVRTVVDSVNKSGKEAAKKRGVQFEPVSKLEVRGVWTHDTPTGHVNEQKAASNGFRVGANSMYEVEVTENGIELTERAEEWTKIRGGNNGPARSGWLRTREHVLFIDNDIIQNNKLKEYGEGILKYFDTDDGSFKPSTFVET